MPQKPADWLPTADAVADARITAFAAEAERRSGRALPDYDALWRWSVEDLEEFWAAVWDHVDMPARPVGPVVADDRMPGTRWFPGVTLNFTAEVFRDRPAEGTAVICTDESGAVRAISWAELESMVASLAAVLAESGVGSGDRVVGYLPNGIEAVVGFLATASLGAIWALCGLDYAGDAALARFEQLEPTVLLAADSTVVAGRTVDRRADLDKLRAGLTTLSATITCATARPGALTWEDSTRRAVTALEPVDVPFDHPLWVLFSSGTTGRPKGIVHGHGGIVLEHRKYAALQLDLRQGDRVFWYTSPSWMMWNFQVGTLLEGATVVCYEGSPTHPKAERLWQLSQTLGVALLGVSPGYLAACRKSGVDLSTFDLPHLRCVGVTGSTLPGDLHRWAIDGLPARAQVVSSSGGTDVATGFVAAAPTLPVWVGEISAPCLGVAVDAVDASGRSVRGEVGELVIRRPMPSMPLCFWNDPGGSRLREAYFDMFPGIWRHGDWITLTDRGSVAIHGRSDATLNRRGVRMGSGDIYAPVEALPEVLEALVIGLEEDDGGYWMPLFVETAPGIELDDELRESIRSAIRTAASPRHVPDEIIAAPGIPHTRTGKRLEVPVKRLLRGEEPDRVVDAASVDRADLLPWYVDIGRQHRREVARSA